ncbi:MAG: hypothetical protein ACE5HO_06540 [bacterium]
MTLNELLERSHATSEFKQAVAGFANGEDSPLIEYAAGSPSIKIMRVLIKLLEEYPEKPIDYVNIQGSSSCSAFTGVLTFGPDNMQIQFDWDCHWKAEQENLRTWYGGIDQSKAAQRFGYQCFRLFQEIEQVDS